MTLKTPTSSRFVSSCSLFLLAAICVPPLQAEMPWIDGDRVLFLGDSITQNGRYVALVEAYLWAAYPERDIDIVGAGLSSETASGLTEPVHPFPRPNVNDRLTRALDLVKPNWVVVCYGMNDGIYHPAEPRIVDAYRAGLTKAINEISASGANVILLTPPSFDPNANAVQANLKAAKADEPYGYKKPFEQYDQTLETLGDVVESLRDYKGVERIIDIHEATDRYLRRMRFAEPNYQYGDGVHPPDDGHLVMATGLLSGLDCDSTDVQTTLQRLTGIASSVDSIDANEQQSSFTNSLFERFSTRSTAYRKAIGSVSLPKVEAPSLPEADGIAAESETGLRSRIAEQTILAPYREAAMKKWNSDIEILELLDKSEPDPKDAVLFIGSSSIRLWETIAQDMAPYATISRGYGGAKYSDLAVFAKRLITPHRYRAIVIFVGNDVTGSQDDPSPEEVASLARYVSDVSLEHQPDAPVFLVEVTPTPIRFKHWPKIVDVNAGLREITLTKPGTHFIATADQYLDNQKRPQAELFREDRLHQNEVGYVQWTSLIKRHLDDVLAKKK